MTLTKEIELVDRTTRKAANTVNEISTYNNLADVLGQPKRTLRYGRTELRKALTAIATGDKPLTHVEQAELCRNSVEKRSRNPEARAGYHGRTRVRNRNSQGKGPAGRP